jgi:hypothetical protein
MARELAFKLGEEDISAPILKIDRKKIYGWVDKVALDRDGSPCHFGAISADGLHIFSKASFEQGYVDDEGNWLDRKSIKYLNAEGEELETIKSSFDQTIVLEQTATLDEYLLHCAKSVYQLDAPEALRSAVKNQEDFYWFPFNYTASRSPDKAFLIDNDEGLFMLVCEPTHFKAVGQPEVEVVMDTDVDEEDEDDMDFGMM